MQVSAIIAAGGRGLRFGVTRPKQLLMVAGRPILERSVTVFRAHPLIAEVVVAVPAELVDDPPPYLVDAHKPVRVVAGGPRRQDSVQHGFEACDTRSDLIVVHDAARPFPSAALIARTVTAAAETGAALAALPARDTVKRTRDAGRPDPAGGPPGPLPFVAETLARDTIFLAQTPQAFRRQVLQDALALSRDLEATDEATLVERAGHPVRLVMGEPTNIKITTPDDLRIADALARDAADGPPIPARVGVGYDLHRLVEGRPFVLGGVTVPFEKGLLGHSDADAVCHAVTDAVLGAAAAGDIGRHFPDTDSRWRGASSLDLLRTAAAIVRGGGFSVLNVDVVVIAERPKLGPYVASMRARVADALGIDVDQVSIKGKSNEGLGEIGRGEAIAVHAIAAIVPAGP